ncbi:hypothetical protein [Magnetovibrio sp.]|uniref:hypothetical protein n=1 Tax=Magnetovibrio sp. TaxID=2024836 RepID=UPI002F920690
MTPPKTFRYAPQVIAGSKMIMKKLCSTMLLIATVTGCVGYDSRTELTANTQSVNFSVPGNYQAVFHCYSPQAHTGVGLVFNELNLAEHHYTIDGRWVGIAEFRRSSDHVTDVSLRYTVEDVRERERAIIESCASQ